MTDQPTTPQPKKQPPRLRVPRRAPAPGVAGILHPGEKVMQVAIIHPGIYWKAVVLFLFSIFLLLTVFNLGILMLAVSGIAFVTAWLTKHYLMLVLTDTRVLIRYGVLSLEAVQMHYNRVESVELAWTPMGRILGYSTVLVTGTGSRVSVVPFVANGLAFRSELDRLISVRDDKPIKVEVENPGNGKT